MIIKMAVLAIGCLLLSFSLFSALIMMVKAVIFSKAKEPASFNFVPSALGAALGLFMIISATTLL